MNFKLALDRVHTQTKANLKLIKHKIMGGFYETRKHFRAVSF